MGLSEARKKLEDLKGAQVEHRLPEVLGNAAGRPRTVRDLAEEFYRVRIVPKRRRPETVRRVLDHDLLPAMGGRSLAGFSTEACRALVKKVVARGAATYAGTVLGVLKQMGRFAQGSSYLDANPAASLEAEALGVEANEDDRWLTSEEIPLWWKALDASVMTPTVRDGLRLLLFTGLRTGELLKAKWPDVDFKEATLTVPVENQKVIKKHMAKARPFVVPLAPQAVALLQELKRLDAKERKRVEKEDPEKATTKEPWVMYSPESGEGRISDKALALAMRRLWKAHRTRGNRKTKGEVLPPLLAIKPASPHDLRRTMRTHYVESLGVEPYLAELALNHSLGKIFRTYDRGNKELPKRRDAALRWADFVGRLVRGESAKVVGIKAAQ
jgi:integrase